MCALDLATGVKRPLAAGAGDQIRPAWISDTAFVYFGDGDGGDVWDVLVTEGDATRVLAEDVRLPLRQRPALTPDRRGVAFAPHLSRDGTVAVIAVDGWWVVDISTGLLAPGELALARRGDRVLLAVTGGLVAGVDLHAAGDREVHEGAGRGQEVPASEPRRRSGLRWA